jgi:hypothetical protein
LAERFKARVLLNQRECDDCAEVHIAQRCERRQNRRFVTGVTLNFQEAWPSGLRHRSCSISANAMIAPKFISRSDVNEGKTGDSSPASL